MSKMKTFTYLAPFSHKDQQMTRTTKIKRQKEIQEDDNLFTKEEIAEYCATNQTSSVKSL